MNVDAETKGNSNTLFLFGGGVFLDKNLVFFGNFRPVFLTERADADYRARSAPAVRSGNSPSPSSPLLHRDAYVFRAGAGTERAEEPSSPTPRQLSLRVKPSGNNLPGMTEKPFQSQEESFFLLRSLISFLKKIHLLNDN